MLWSLPSAALSDILKNLPTEVHTAKDTGSGAVQRARSQPSAGQGAPGSPQPGKLDGASLRAAKAIIAALRKHRLASVFNQPVDPVRDGAPDYLSVVTKVDTRYSVLFIF